MFRPDGACMLLFKFGLPPFRQAGTSPYRRGKIVVGEHFGKFGTLALEDPNPQIIVFATQERTQRHNNSCHSCLEQESPTQPGKTKNEMPAFASMTMKNVCYFSFEPESGD